MTFSCLIRHFEAWGNPETFDVPGATVDAKTGISVPQCRYTIPDLGLSKEGQKSAKFSAVCSAYGLSSPQEFLGT